MIKTYIPLGKYYFDGKLFDIPNEFRPISPTYSVYLWVFRAWRYWLHQNKMKEKVRFD